MVEKVEEEPAGLKESPHRNFAAALEPHLRASTGQMTRSTSGLSQYLPLYLSRQSTRPRPRAS